jgi:hypothetical protein
MFKIIFHDGDINTQRISHPNFVYNNNTIYYTILCNNTSMYKRKLNVVSYIETLPLCS